MHSTKEYSEALKATRWPEHIAALRLQIRTDTALDERERAELLRLADKREGKR